MSTLPNLEEEIAKPERGRSGPLKGCPVCGKTTEVAIVINVVDIVDKGGRREHSRLAGKTHSRSLNLCREHGDELFFEWAERLEDLRKQREERAAGKHS